MSDSQVFDPAVHLPAYRDGMDWFVLRVHPNKERSVQDTLLMKKEKLRNMKDLGRVLVPTDKKRVLTPKGMKITETLLYPGYVFVEMVLDESKRIPQTTFFIIKETPGVNDFVGVDGKPLAMTSTEVDEMLYHSQRPETLETIQSEFNDGDYVKIIKGPFEGYEGKIDEIMPEKGKIRVVISVFQRLTPVDLECDDIRRI